MGQVVESGNARDQTIAFPIGATASRQCPRIRA